MALLCEGGRFSLDALTSLKKEAPGHQLTNTGVEIHKDLQTGHSCGARLMQHLEPYKLGGFLLMPTFMPAACSSCPA